MRLLSRPAVRSLSRALALLACAGGAVAAQPAVPPGVPPAGVTPPRLDAAVANEPLSQTDE